MKQNVRVLIADDERAITTGLSAIIEDAGYQVDNADDGHVPGLSPEPCNSTVVRKSTVRSSHPSAWS